MGTARGLIKSLGKLAETSVLQIYVTALLEYSPTRKETSSEACQATRAISTTSRRELSSSFFYLQGKAPKEIHAILTETLACFLPGRAKDLTAPLYRKILLVSVNCLTVRVGSASVIRRHE